MRFGLADGLLERFPDYTVGLLVLKDFGNRETSLEEVEMLRRAEGEARTNMSGGSVRDIRNIGIWRERFEKAGINPNKFRISVEALLSRVAKSDGLPNINALVDLINLVSIKYVLPAGAHDIGTDCGDIWVKVVSEPMGFVPMESQEEETVPVGEVVYCDDKGVRTRRWVWRQAERSRVGLGTRAAIIPIDGFAGCMGADVRSAMEELSGMLLEHFGVQADLHILDKSNPVVTIKGKDIAVHPGGGGSDPITDLLERNVVDAINRVDLEKRLRSGEKLRIKLGIDPTGPRIHIGRAVPLRKLKQFQDLGHHIVLIIGDFTAQIGDASDKGAARQMLTPDQVEANMRTYKEQMAGILDISRVEFAYNSDWLGKLGFKDVIGLASNFTVARMLERDNFTERYSQRKPIGLHEFMYPLMQGYDSVMVKADVELGGTDQLFNLMAGRELQKVFGQRPQDIMCTQLIPGTDGRKMSTSWGNIITILDEPETQFGKLMSISDDLIIPYFMACTDVPMVRVKELEAALAMDGLNPIEAKKELALEVVALYHGRQAGLEARSGFERTVQDKGIPEDMPEMSLSGEGRPILDMLMDAGFVPSRNEARRLVEQGGVSIDGVKVQDAKFVVNVPVGVGMVLKAGKRKYLRILGSL